MRDRRCTEGLGGGEKALGAMDAGLQGLLTPDGDAHASFGEGGWEKRGLVLTMRVLEVEQKSSCLGPRLSLIGRVRTGSKKLVSDLEMWRLWSAR